MLKKALKVCAALATISLAACDNEIEDQSCPSNGEAFFRTSIDAYWRNHDDSKVGRYSLQPGAKYNTTEDWWVVPFESEGKRYLAMISCDGHLELSLSK